MAALTPVPKIQFFDANGNPLAGGKLYSYDAGTTTPRPTYTNYGGATPNANPVILDSRGEANVWLDNSLYKLKLTSATDVEIWTVDNVGGPDQATLAQLAASGGSALVGFIQAGTGAVTRTAQAKMRDVLNVKDFGCVCDGVTNDVVNFQKAVDALSPYQTLVAEGSILLSTHVSLRKSHVVYDFRAAKFILPGTGGTAYGAGMLIGDSDDLTFSPTDVTLLGGEYYPAGNSAVYPVADFNPIAVIMGTHIQIKDSRVYAKQSVRAVSIQTDNSAGTGVAPNIDGVYVTGLEVYGDGNGVDGVDIGYAGADDLIRNVHVQGVVFGCKRGVHTYTNGGTDQLNGLFLDLVINNPTVAAGEIGRTKNGKLNLTAQGVTAEGFDLVHFSNVETNINIEGYGAGLGTAVQLREVAAGTYGAVLNANISTSDTNNWTKGLYPAQDYAVYPSINIEDATLGINVTGFKSDWGNVTFRNCTTEIDFPFNLSDSWGDAVSFGAGANPVISRRTFNSSSGSANYGIDLHNQATITLAAGATAKPFGSVAEFSGLLIVNGTAGIGDPAVFIMGGAVSYLVGGASAVYSASSGTASKVNVYYNGSLEVEVQNNTAGSVTLRFFAIRMRNSP